MRRNPQALAEKEYDVLVIGGGIYGISVARDAALRGLRVALIERGDFGHATSSNHHKIVHGGLRYLQHGDLKRMRESIRERSILFRIASHLVHPLPFLIPTYKRRLPGKLLMSIALKLNDLISFDRNLKLDLQKKLPSGRVLSKAECLRLCPDLDQRDLTGGALFFDGQVYNPERLNLSLLFSAVSAGAEVANYVQATGLLQDENRVVGIKIKDVFSGDVFVVRARVVVNCTGACVDHVLQSSGQSRRINLSKELVLVTRPVIGNIALGVPSRFSYQDKDAILKRGFRYLFFTPWRDASLIGTFQSPHNGGPDALAVSEREIAGAIREINEAFPAAALTRQDVRLVLCGFVPGSNGGKQHGDVQLQKHYEIRDHAAEGGTQGLISVIGVKYTTARGVAERVVDLVLKKLGRKPARCRTEETPVQGGTVNGFNDFLRRAFEEQEQARIGSDSLSHLVQTYGTEYRKVLRYCDADPSWAQQVTPDSPIIKAEVLHGVREEMAQKLSDVIFRRTELGTAGYSGDESLQTCAEIMARELGWTETTMAWEVQETKRLFQEHGA